MKHTYAPSAAASGPAAPSSLLDMKIRVECHIVLIYFVDSLMMISSFDTVSNIRYPRIRHSDAVLIPVRAHSGKAPTDPDPPFAQPIDHR